MSNVEHHLAHAALAHFLSPFERSVVITLDGVGEYETLSVHLAEGCRLEKKVAMRMPNSLGLLYSFFTGFCGFAVNEGEYKLMGLAAFADPDYVAHIRPWIDLNLKDPRCATALLQWSVPNAEPISPEFTRIFGAPFRPEKDDHLDPRFAAIAASVQLALEDEIVRLARAALAQWDCDSLCLGGGIALNCNANGRLRREVTPKLFVPPAPGDAGSALGAVLMKANRDPTIGKPRIPFTP